MKKLLIVIAVATVGAFAAGQAASGAVPAQVGPAGAATVGVPFDQQFIDQMAAHHKLAIDMAKMAALHARDEGTKAIARDIVTTQQSEIARFHALRKQWYGKAAFTVYPVDEMTMRSMGP